MEIRLYFVIISINFHLETTSQSSDSDLLVLQVLSD